MIPPSSPVPPCRHTSATVPGDVARRLARVSSVGVGGHRHIVGLSFGIELDVHMRGFAENAAEKE